MQIIVSLVISALMVLGSVAYNSEQSKAVGASQSISSLTELTSLSHNDVFPITEVNGPTTKKVKWGTATSTLKVINDALYSPIIGSASITTLGTITTGTWNADTITVAKGGTGSTSLIAYQLLAGNGTGAVTTFGNGTSGYVLTSNGAGALPSFQNVGVTTGNNNTWTGTNTFTATTTIAASSTTNNAFVLNGLPYKFPSSRGASSTVLTENGLGELIWEMKGGTTTSGTIANNTNTACDASSGINTDTYVSHYLGDTPSLVTVTAEILAKGTGANADGTTGGMGTWNNSGTLVNVFTLKKNGSVTTPVYDVTGFTSSGTGNPSEAVTISMPSATSTGFIFRVNCIYTTSELASTVTNIKWTATR